MPSPAPLDSHCQETKMEIPVSERLVCQTVVSSFSFYLHMSPLIAFLLYHVIPRTACSKAQASTIGAGSCQETESCRDIEASVIYDNTCNEQYACAGSFSAGREIGPDSCYGYASCFQIDADIGTGMYEPTASFLSIYVPYLLFRTSALEILSRPQSSVSLRTTDSQTKRSGAGLWVVGSTPTFCFQPEALFVFVF